MSAPLAGIPVIVTRPARQAGPFVQRLGQLGALAVALPALEIEPVALDEAQLERVTPDRHDWAIYTSANAVRESVGRLPRPARCRVAAIGRATARALEAQGIVVHALPQAGSDSEALLALDELQDVRGSSILIVKGEGGRDALATTLAARGATVTTAAVYRRIRPSPPAAAITAADEALRRGAVVAATSVEVLEALLGIVPAASRERLLTSTLLVPGERVERAARGLGWSGRTIVAASAEDDAMLLALLDHAAAQGELPSP